MKINQAKSINGCKVQTICTMTLNCSSSFKFRTVSLHFLCLTRSIDSSHAIIFATQGKGRPDWCL